MTTLAYTANPGAPHYVAPTMRLFRAGPHGANEVPLPHWKPLSVHWRCNGEISTMEIECVLGEGSGKARVRPESVVMNAGDRIRLVDIATDEEWFRGHASHQSLMIQAGQDIESVRWVVLGPEKLLAQKVVEGQWCKTETADDWNIAQTLDCEGATRDTVWQTAHPCIFNEHGRPNANNSRGGSPILTHLRWKLDSVGATYSPDAINNDCLVFEPCDRTVSRSGTDGTNVIGTEWWDTYTALRSIVEWLDRHETLDWLVWFGIQAVLSAGRDRPARLPETNVQGKSLLEAMAAILLPQGFGFYIEPWAMGNVHRLSVFSLACPAVVKTPNLAALAAGANVGVTSPAGQRAVVQRLNFARDSGGVANQIIVQGDYKRVQVALDFGGGELPENWDIKPFWNTTTHAVSNWYVGGKFPNQLSSAAVAVAGDSFFDRHHPDGSEYAQYRHVYRTWTWNEDGHASEFGWAIPTMGAFDLNDPTTALSARYTRPMGAALAEDKGVRIRASVWMAIADSNGTIDAKTWMNVTPEIWRDRCAFTMCAPCQMTDKGLVPWYPWRGGGKAGKGSGSQYENLSFLELLHNAITVAEGEPKLLLRFVGTVASDGVVRGLGTSIAGAGGGSRWPLTSTRIVDRRNRYYHKEVLHTHTWTANPTDIADDSADIQADANSLAAVAGAEMGHGSILLRHLSRQYEIGDGVPQTAGRVIDFSLDVGGDRVPIIMGITWTFANEANKTEIVLDSPMLGIT